MRTAGVPSPMVIRPETHEQGHGAWLALTEPGSEKETTAKTVITLMLVLGMAQSVSWASEVRNGVSQTDFPRGSTAASARIGASCAHLPLSNASYSIYLFHPLVAYGLSAPWYIRVLLAIALGCVMHWLVERRILAFRTSRTRKAGVAFTAASVPAG